MGESHMMRTVDAGASDVELLALYDAQVRNIYAFALRRCGNVELAEDLTQDTFVAAARHFRDTAEVPPRAWLYQVTRNRLIDHWRREARRARKLRLLSADGSDAAQLDPAETVVDGQRVMNALDQLPINQRAVLILRYLDDYSVSKVAETLGRSTKATESLLARARRSLELNYGERDGE